MKIEIDLDEVVLEEKLKAIRSASFSNSLQLLLKSAASVRLSKKYQYPTFILNSKLITYEFGKLLNVNVPKIHQIDCSIDDIEFRRNSVIKPMYDAQAKGVFIYDDNHLIYLNSKQKFANDQEAKCYAKQLIDDNTVKKDKWMVEEILHKNGKIARDVKFYMFYGEVGLILESERLPKLKRCWYDSNFNYVDTGKYSKNLFQGNKIYLNLASELAKKISLEIPAPFVRIDFLMLDDEIYLGETTPLPSASNAFNYEWDKKMGEMFQNAVTRLICDFVYGKKFDYFLALEKDEKNVIQNLKNNLLF